MYASSNSTIIGPRQLPIDASYTKRVANGYWSQGSLTPKVTLVEYTDYENVPSGILYAIIGSAISKTSAVAQFQFKNYPVVSIHNKAQVAARAAEAAGRQGKFWQMHDLLLARQSDWINQTTDQFPDTLSRYASDIELNVDQFKSDLHDSAIDDPITKDVADGNAVDVTFTPTLLLNGKLISTLPTTTEELVKLINDAASTK